MEWQNKLEERLKAQADEFTRHLYVELEDQRVKLHKDFERDVVFKVDRERAGRLGRLDSLALKLGYLQRKGVVCFERVERMDQLMKLGVLLDQVTRDVDSKRSVVKQIDSIVQSDPDMKIVLDGLVEKSYLSPKELEDLFGKIKDVLPQASLLPTSTGPISYAISTIISPFFSMKSAGLAGGDVIATLKRCDKMIAHGDYEGVCREFANLKGWSRVIVDDWVAGCIGYLEIKQALEIADTRVKMRQLGTLQ